MATPQLEEPGTLLQRVLYFVAYPERAVHRTVLASIVGVVALSNLAALPFVILFDPPGIRSFSGLLIAALSLEITLLAFLAVAHYVRRARLDLSRFSLQTFTRRLFLGLLAGPALFIASAVVQAAMAALFDIQQTQLDDFIWIRELELRHYLIVLFVIAVVAPVAEEWFFRGYVFRAYTSGRGLLWAFLASSALFALLHLNVPAAPPIFVMGLILAWLYRRTGSLVSPIVAHGFNNGIAFLALYFAPLEAMV